MTTSRHRGYSPPPPPRYEDSRPFSGGIYATQFDSRFDPSRRFDTDRSLYGYPGAERRYRDYPTSRGNYPATDHPTVQSRHEYPIRHRPGSLRVSDGRPQYRALQAPSSHKTSPYVNQFPVERSRSPPSRRYYYPDEPGYNVLPASSNSRSDRRRVSDPPTDSGYLMPNSRGARDQKTYKVQPSRAYPVNTAPTLYEEEGEDGYSYTTPREQFERDYPPPQPRPHRNSHLRDRDPNRKYDSDERAVSSHRRRESGPSSSLRQPDDFRDDDLRYKGDRPGEYSDAEGGRSHRSRRPQSLRVPVSLHQDTDRRYSPEISDRDYGRSSRYRDSERLDDEPSYSSDRENYRPSSHYERHRYRVNDSQESRERSSKAPQVAAVGLSGVAASGLAGALVKHSRGKDEDSDSAEARDARPRRRHQRDRSYDPRYGREQEEDESRVDPSKDRRRTDDRARDRKAAPRGEDRSRKDWADGGERTQSGSDPADDTQEDSHRARRKHRHRHRQDDHRRRRHSKPDDDRSASSSDKNLSDERAGVRKLTKKDRTRRDSSQDEPDQSYRSHKHVSEHREVPSGQEKTAGTQESDQKAESDTDRASRLQLVEPAKTKDAEVKPTKGILKPARQVPFPEDPNPTREGVAPLKDANKKGIPPGARWTKVNRMLVNPAALDAAHERYEERADYVIVLRVLSREEIEKLAEQTKKIREARDAEWDSRRSQSKQIEAAPHYSVDADSNGHKKEKNNDLEDGSREAKQRSHLAIEAAPISAPAVPPDRHWPSTDSASVEPAESSRPETQSRANENLAIPT